MLQKLLAERFHLELHRDEIMTPGYDLIIAADGSKLIEVHSGEANLALLTNNPPGPLVDKQINMTFLSSALGGITGRPVRDKTGLTGVYDLTLNWDPASSDSLLTAVHEQLGLILQPQTSPVEILVVDLAEEIVADDQLNARRIN